MTRGIEREWELEEVKDGGEEESKDKGSENKRKYRGVIEKKNGK